MHLLTELIGLHSLLLEVPQPQAAAEGAGMCSHMCSLPLHPASALPSAPATSSIPNFPATAPASPGFAGDPGAAPHLTPRCTDPQERAESSSLRRNLGHFVDKW